jgi:hypothetical protein
MGTTKFHDDDLAVGGDSCTSVAGNHGHATEWGIFDIETMMLTSIITKCHLAIVGNAKHPAGTTNIDDVNASHATFEFGVYLIYGV